MYEEIKSTGCCTSVVFALFTVTANAAFTGRLPTTPVGSDWQAFYDDQL